MNSYYYDNRISGKLQAQIKKFSRRVTKGFKKPDRKWIGETIYGILKSRPVCRRQGCKACPESIREKGYKR